MEGPGMKSTGKGFTNGDAKLLADGIFSDCQVVCGNRTWKTHKSILCTRSKWFMTALSGGFKEAQSATVEIQEFSPQEVGTVMEYIYTGVIDDLSGLHRSQYIWPIQLYRLADFFQMEEMMDSCVAWLKDHCQLIAGQVQRNVIYRSRFRDIASTTTLESPTLVEALKMAYDGDQLPQPNRMQQELIEFLNKACWAFLNSPDFMKQIKTIPGTIGFDILMARPKVFKEDSTLADKCKGGCDKSIDSEDYQISFAQLKIADDGEYHGVCMDCVGKQSTTTA